MKRTHTEIGIGLTGFGVLFTVLGVLLLFDGGFLAMGNVRWPVNRRDLARAGMERAPLR